MRITVPLEVGEVAGLAQASAARSAGYRVVPLRCLLAGLTGQRGDGAHSCRLSSSEMVWAPRAYLAVLPVVCQPLIVIVAEHTHFLLVKRGEMASEGTKGYSLNLTPCSVVVCHCSTLA